ncbi:hypothetical protein FB451DRAFT_1166048 [Mycena latifolia]|nr:hypothetical protein FB451DRAFT_1166048 [Mycena latifolia]
MKRIQAKVIVSASPLELSDNLSQVEGALRRFSGVPASAESSPPITGEPILPPELEREIFELVAATEAPPDHWMHQHVGNTVLVLPRVCRRAQIWIEPFIYERVSLLQTFHGLDPIPSFLATIDARPASFFAAHVKHLYIAPTTPLAVVQRVLAVCTGVVSFGCHHPYTRLAPLLAPLPLRRLLVSELPPIPAELAPWAASLTHLGLVQVFPTATTLAHLPALTHLAVDYAALPDPEAPGMGAALTALLAAGPNIRCLVLVSAAKTDWALQRLRDDAFSDPRLYMHSVMDGAWDAWSRHMPDMFAQAEERRGN